MQNGNKPAKKFVKVTMNGREYQMKAGLTILAAAFETHKFPQEYMWVDIPTLYYLRGVNDIDTSGVCVVEANGELVNASIIRIEDGMEVVTDTPRTEEARKAALEKILAIHTKNCLECTRGESCELQQLLSKYEITAEPQQDRMEKDTSSCVLVRDNNKCIKCKRCINVCAKVQAVSAICATGEGLDTLIVPSSYMGLAASSCVNCGQCVAVCPVGALTEKDQTAEVWAALNDPKKYVVVQVAPAVRAALGESFGFPVGVDVEGRLAGALRKLGFDKVFDTKFGADLTVMEEANELIERLTKQSALPMFTSCCPAWIKYCEHFYPDMLPNLSTCKSPHQMLGAVAKSFYAKQLDMDKEDIIVVSVMPCTAKKFEITREDECGAGVPDVDISITTRELARMMKKADIKLEAFSPDETFDAPLGIGSGAGVIFGVSGGVMEAALRTAVTWLTGEERTELEFTAVRGMSGVKEACCLIDGQEIKVAVVSGLANANNLLSRIKNGDAEYQFVEVMACPGGCINGAGQPYKSANEHVLKDVPLLRANALYTNDANSCCRTSHTNPAITALYNDFLKAPGSEKAHQLLHTTYVIR